LTHPGGPSLARARALALDPDSATPDESAHLATCGHCRQNIARLSEQLPHPRWWHLLRCARGEDTVAKSLPTRLHGHLTGECRACRQGLRDYAQKTPSAFRCPLARPLPHPGAARAHAGGNGEVARRDGLLCFNLHLDGSTFFLDLFSRAPTLAEAVVGYAFLDAAGEALCDGLAPLSPADREGWSTARVRLDPTDLPDRTRFACRALLLAPVPLELLAAGERPSLAGSAARAPTASWTPLLARLPADVRQAVRPFIEEGLDDG
jgi:hypothetical protein